MQIAFLGLGTMGKPMAANLIKAGYPVSAWNRTAETPSSLAALGAFIASSPAEAVKDADIVISILADDKATHEVMIKSGLIDQIKKGAIHINMATISVALANQLVQTHQEKGIGYIAAPVLGRVNVAEAGKLNILTAGDAAALQKIQPLLDVLGQKTWYFGDNPAQANVVKLAVNFMIASAIGTMGEAVALAQGYGTDKADFIDLITSTVFAAPVYQGYGSSIASETFEPAGFKLALGHKDIKLSLEAGEQVNVPMPIASVLRDNHLDGLAHDEGELDWAALSRVSLRRAGQR